MLKGLHIRDMLIIDLLELDFQPGLNVLTGETGAGKSILLDSLGFVLGWRGRAELVRQGAEQGEVIAEFELHANHPARTVLREAGLPEEDELILRRVNTKDGRKTAWVNDRRCSGDVLRQLSETLVELHGQHDDRGLLNASGHRDLLDQYGNLESLKADLRAAWSDLARTRRKLDEAQDAQEKLRSDEDFLRHAVGELDALAPHSGEEADLDAQRRLMQGAERLREEIAKAAHAVGPAGAEGATTDAIRWLESVSDQAEGQLEAPLAALGRALVEIDEAASGLDRAMEKLTFNSNELEEVEERLFAIRALARKHGVGPDDLDDFAKQLRTKLATLDQGVSDIAALKDAVLAAQDTYQNKADTLSQSRRDAAAKLDRAVKQELAPLKLERAEFKTLVDRGQAGPDGQDEVVFTVATNPGAPAGALNKIASGGELSRFLLALKVCLTGSESGVTLIFDEIDRGVGGATAGAVGRRLEQIAQGGQVLVVTHSPQVAARGGSHWRVEKQISDDETRSRVVPLGEKERVDEIARMLADDRITDEARAAARKLMNG